MSQQLVKHKTLCPTRGCGVSHFLWPPTPWLHVVSFLPSRSSYLVGSSGS